ncbi:MAG: photosynthetic complex putative assembly protein PuhB [Paracoccaceae bacterium]
MPNDDFNFEPVHGLPEALPKGEEILWQGRPNWLALARESLWLYPVAGYFLLLAFWRFGTLADQVPASQALVSTLPFIAAGVVVGFLLIGIACIQARLTVYTITSARVVMRIGAALTITINLPFREIANASLDLKRNGTGTIAFEMSGKTRLSYLVLWPHIRPWRMNPAQPALRCIDDAKSVADLISDAAQSKISEPIVMRADLAAPVAAE